MRLIPGFAALALIATPVLAQTTSPAPEPPPGHTAAGKPAAGQAAPNQTATGKPDPYRATLDQRIARMKQTLGITPAQQAAWNDFSGVMRQNADAIEHAYRNRSDHMKTMTASENLRDYASIEQDRAQGVQHLAASFDTLYGQLSDQQKQAADTMFRQYALNRQQRGMRH